MSDFDIAAARDYGNLVNIAYAMFDTDHNNLKPAPIHLPSKYKFVAWVQMADFFFEQDTFRFYGLIVQRAAQPNQFILAIRGTVTGLEWLDNLVVNLVPLQAFGNVEEGFDLIFKTMRVVKADGTLTDEFGTGMGFAEQVAAAVKSASAPSGTTVESLAAKSLDVTGHSLGGALATLYAAKNANITEQLHIERLYTFASPRVGDANFANAFNKLGIDSWRIVNEVDVVPMVPPGPKDIPPGPFEHVNAEKAYPPADVATNAPCAHRMSSYLHLIKPAWYAVDWDCDANGQHGPAVV